VSVGRGHAASQSQDSSECPEDGRPPRPGCGLQVEVDHIVLVAEEEVEVPSRARPGQKNQRKPESGCADPRQERRSGGTMHLSNGPPLAPGQQKAARAGLANPAMSDLGTTSGRLAGAARPVTWLSDEGSPDVRTPRGVIPRRCAGCGRRLECRARNLARLC